jgi:hypothetical protein
VPPSSGSRIPKINAYSPNYTASRPGALLLELKSRIIIVARDLKTALTFASYKVLFGSYE